MPEKNRKQPEPRTLTVGTRVLVQRQFGHAEAGAIVEDYSDLTDTAERGHDWAPVHRWAVALDDGRLVFADTADLTIEPGTRGSGPGARTTG
ncbi:MULTISPECIES: hypothetical protein [Rhodococcus]|jgi:hypothetical protein|uniref:Uncharacterized protein n=1 Tax=Rhodococcus jostii (strain RHA1) TaxID=101510 RepID=Q0SIT0_RHOJR|nr:MULTISPECIES: hypothetical protein [Rhodococcus]ABG92556.1 conserved hypothetical protein [Rhodococcus jostii RHA1]